MEPHETSVGHGYIRGPSRNKFSAPDTKERLLALSLALLKSGSRTKRKPTTWWQALAQVNTPPGSFSIRPPAPPYCWKQRMMLRDALSHTMDQLSVENRDDHG